MASNPPSEKFAQGAAKFEEVIGFAPPERGPDFLKLTVEGLFADCWARPGLARRDRSLMTLSITIALRHWEEFALHVRAAKNNGLTDEEIGEVIQHAAIYAGVPAANHAFKVAAPILEELRGTSA